MKVSVEVKRGPVTHQVSVTTTSIERALQLAGGNQSGTEARVLFPIEPEEFFLGGFDPARTLPESVEPVREPARELTEVAA